MPYILILLVSLTTLTLTLPVILANYLDKFESLFRDHKGRHVYYDSTLIELEDEDRALDSWTPSTFFASLKQLYNFLF